MIETTQLLSTIKNKLQSQDMTYRDVAHTLNLSELSVKRVLTSGRPMPLSKRSGVGLLLAVHKWGSEELRKLRR